MLHSVDLEHMGLRSEIRACSENLEARATIRVFHMLLCLTRMPEWVLRRKPQMLHMKACDTIDPSAHQIAELVTVTFPEETFRSIGAGSQRQLHTSANTCKTEVEVYNFAVRLSDLSD